MGTRYTAEATAYGEGRNGEVRSSDGVIDGALWIPNEMGGAGAPPTKPERPCGAGGDATNPEQLFAAGYAACFNSALASVARAGKIQLPSSEVTAKVGIGPNGTGGFQLTVELAVHIPGFEQAVAEKLVEQAHQ